MHFRGSCFHESFHAVVGAPTEVHGLQAATISSECTSVEASMSSVEEELITSMEASIVSIEAPTGFHGSSPKLAGKLLSQGWRPLSWKYSKFSEEIATASEEASVQLPRK